MTHAVYDMVMKYLKDIGADGLYNSDLECSCGLDNLMPSGGCLVHDCSAARKAPVPDNYKQDYHEWYEVIKGGEL